MKTIGVLLVILAVALGIGASSSVAPAVGGVSLPDCSATAMNFGDSFETSYSTNGGLSPGVCHAQSVQPGVDPSGNTWKNTSPNYCENRAVSPTPGAGSYSVQVNAVSGQGVKGSSEPCLWVNRWRYEQQGADYYYGFMWYFASPWVTPYGTEFEFNLQPAICGAPENLHFYADAVKLRVHTGYVDCVESNHSHHAVGSPQYSNGNEYETSSGNLGGLDQWSVIPKGQLQPDEWYEVIVHIHWAADATGQIQSWYRLEGQSTWNPTINQSGFPTLQWGCLPDDATNSCFTITQTNQNGWATSDHFGVYRYCDRDPCPPDTFYLDNYQERGSFAAVASTMP